MIVAVGAGGYVEAADAFRSGNRAAADVHDTLLRRLAVLGGMAGDDATGAAFAAAYDDAASEALDALGDVATAHATLGRLTVASWANHGRAEARSILPGGVVTVDSCTPPPEAAYRTVLPATPPTALGGDAPVLSPQEAWILDHVEGFVWPDADIERLRSAAHAWRAAADGLDGVAAYAGIAVAALDTQRSPEIPLATAATSDLRATIRELSASCAGLAAQCEAYAAEVEVRHAQIRALVAEILQFVVEGLVIGAVLGAVTAGAGAAAATGSIAARVAAQSPRFAAVLTALRARTTGIATSVRTTRAAIRVHRSRLARYARPEIRVAAFGSRSVGSAQRLRYVPSPKHHPGVRGRVSSAPGRGQDALDFSIPIAPTTTRRVGVDPGSGRFVVFDETLKGQFHGHIRNWSELDQAMQSVLRKAGIVNRRGKIIDEGYH